MELTTEPFPGRLPVRPVAASVSETMRESCKPRLVAAIGPRMSSATVRRVPTGETCALCCRVGAKRSNQTPKASTQIIEDARPGQPDARGGDLSGDELGRWSGVGHGQNR